ncbi:MAG TPA: PaaX family transcriptional regulator [Candidatus Binatia bacterium]|nr:PaaX family transcriptional regulator [Candidatus Binatia bacterium]
MAPSAKSVVLDLLSTLPRGSMPVGTLVAAGALFGLAENAIRVTITRLLSSGLVERDERGQYRLGARTGAVSTQVASWRRLADRTRVWDGGWIAVHTAGLARADRAAGRQRSRALHFLGLRELSVGLAVRPDNLAGGIDATRARLYALGLDATAPVFVVRDLDDAITRRAHALWPATSLVAEWRTTRQALERSERQLPQLPLERAMVESFLVGGRAIRQLVLDPLLPERIVPAHERDLLVATLRRYDRLGRTVWATFLRGFGVPHLHAPADVRIDAPGGLAADGGLA